jgi:hypothetical protein
LLIQEINLDLGDSLGFVCYFFVFFNSCFFSFILQHLFNWRLDSIIFFYLLSIGFFTDFKNNVLSCSLTMRCLIIHLHSFILIFFQQGYFGITTMSQILCAELGELGSSFSYLFWIIFFQFFPSIF